MESILTSVKKLLGLTEEYAVFDRDLIMHINSVFMILQQMGVGPEEGFSITDATETWSDYMGEGSEIAAVKSYMALRVRLLFDPPQSSVTMEAIKNQIKELEYRLYIACDKEAGN